MSLQISESTNPTTLFETWFSAATEAGVIEPNAMTLASSDPEGNIFARIVLLKIHDENGYCFFTNYESQKGTQLLACPKAAFVFHWRQPEHRQIRMTGSVEKMSYKESDSYFQTRPRGSQIAAWASPQSQVVESREALDQRMSEVEKKYEGDEVIPCPPHWGGFRMRPLAMEFWQEQKFRRHDRFRFQRKAVSSPWTLDRLAP